MVEWMSHATLLSEAHLLTSSSANKGKIGPTNGLARLNNNFCYLSADNVL
jgi:hypothetical protein